MDEERSYYCAICGQNEGYHDSGECDAVKRSMSLPAMSKPKETKIMNDYQKRQARCKCLSDRRRGYIEAAMNFASDFSDGAFMGYMEELGIDVSELEVFATDHDCNYRQRKNK